MNIGKLARVIQVHPASEPIPEAVDLSELEGTTDRQASGDPDDRQPSAQPRELGSGAGPETRP